MYKKKAHIHFVGIGGIGMSGIATILKYQGYEISGCDLDLDQTSVKNLKDLGCHIYHGNNTPSCNDSAIDILVYSSAIKALNTEITAAQARGIPTIPRAVMLAELMRTKYGIAITGSHGKTTTTSLISHILIEANIDPTVIIGGHLKNISNNARFGNGDFLVAEADESDRSFLYLNATLAIVTNIDLEHLETYTDLDDIKDTFKRFLNNIPFYGKAIVCIDDANVRSLLPIPHVKTIKYGLTTDADFYATDIDLQPDHSTYTVWHKGNILGVVTFNMPGRHNILNSLAAIALANDLDVPFNVTTKALQNFKGIERRFCFKGSFKGADFFDDYGHHPQEILNTLLVAKRRTKKKLTVIFQPHRFTRTYALWNDFVDVFVQSNIDHLIITDIYPASEAPIPEITSQNLVKAILLRSPKFTVSYAPYESDYAIIRTQLEPLLEANDLVLLLGAGKINKLADVIIPLSA
ncbi:MAG: UDP-N-acetylmuramate--L-alanine ligase [Candidatus Dependentiae bacterium]|nr:UDP-N-acetylmuramate--L-alanine ligase [Candidatus Dependentiae bacterium]